MKKPRLPAAIYAIGATSLRASPRDALIADAAPRELHGRAFGVYEAMDHAGAVVGPLGRNFWISRQSQTVRCSSHSSF